MPACAVAAMTVARAPDGPRCGGGGCGAGAGVEAWGAGRGGARGGGGGLAAAWAGAIEKSQQFNILAFSVVPVSPPAAPGMGVAIGDPLLSAGVGKDFIIWTEIWPGPVDSQNKLPTGNRIAYGCVESGPLVSEITSADDRQPDGGVGRIMSVILP